MGHDQIVRIREGRQFNLSKIKIPPKMNSSAWSNVLTCASSTGDVSYSKYQTYPLQG